MSNKNIGDFWSDITDPKVDLKFFNDFIRNGIGLGLAWAIGVYLAENATKTIERYSAYVIFIVAMALFVLNIIQFAYAIAKTFNSQRVFARNSSSKSILLTLGFAIGALNYVAIVMIFVGNFQIILQEIAPITSG